MLQLGDGARATGATTASASTKMYAEEDTAEVRTKAVPELSQVIHVRPMPPTSGHASSTRVQPRPAARRSAVHAGGGMDARRIRYQLVRSLLL